MLADVEGHAGGEDEQHRDEGDHGNRHHGLADAHGHFGTGLLGGAFDVFEVDAGTEHPAPAIEHHHVGELVGHLAGGGFVPGIALKTFARLRAFEQRLDHRQAVGIFHVPQVLAHQFRLARMHQAAAFVVVDEEVAVDAKAELAQFFQHLLLGTGIAVAVVVQGRDQALGHFHVVFQLRALARQNAVFDQLRLLIAQLAIEGNHQRADDGNGQHQRQNPEGDDLVFELHVDSCPREGSGSYAKDT
ncbi:hypothetical protein D3C73_518760 [compost metagenome]